MTLKQRRSVAYHEAGHATLAHLFKLPFEHVTIVPGENSLGHVLLTAHVRPRTPLWQKVLFLGDPTAKLFDVVELLTQRSQAERYVMFYFAGRIAQEKIYKGSFARGGHSEDYRLIAKLVLRFGGPAKAQPYWRRWLQAWSKAIVEYRWNEVIAVAEALLERKHLTSGDVAKIIDNAKLK